MSVGADEPEEEPREDERLADDSTPVEDVTPEQKRGRPKGMTARQSVALSEQIWAEYASGMSMRQIGDVHGMTHVAVSKRIRQYRAEMGLEDVTEAKSLDLGRYEALIERVWVMTFKDPIPENVRSLAMLMDQRAKLLGLNAPRKLQVDGQMTLAPSPAFLGHLDRIVEERERLGGNLTREAIAAPEDEILDAELVSDDPDD